jgi:hypothetical protein
MFGARHGMAWHINGAQPTQPFQTSDGWLSNGIPFREVGVNYSGFVSTASILMSMQRLANVSR